ncbi:MAG: ATP synthase F0 subunit A [Nitrospinae bacterium RIFCSPLOWO2_12_39_16]|nr:MAG: ATP synthase F0 subunit A [Nitrospinae bacterium RIFCSPLOWO2_02_39_17]OGW07925.1 MAG: ATP synthase F0 subunit A [Nitrospinae bacterium RIFCSPLOWO2_12_39_16]HLA48752.1 F0F1 ATP synthase subunit A [Nitrospinota bacterium]
MEEPLLYINVPGLEHYPHVTYTWVIMIVLAISSYLVGRRITLIPEGGGQNFFEAAVEWIANFMEENIGHGGSKYMPLIGTLAFFILSCNLIGLIPGFISPTANINTNAAMAVVVFLSYHYIGIKKHGIVKYSKSFAGPIWWLAPLMLPVEIIAHLARPLTLTLRLFGNIKGEDLVLIILASVFPLLAPVPMMFLAILTSIIQTVIFSLLSMFYIAGALEEHH